VKPDRLILVFDADSGWLPLVGDVIKKIAGREDCSLCAITYSPVGKKRAWQACESRLGLAVEERHRDQLPAAWSLGRAQLPCILARAGEALPSLLISRDEIAACDGSMEKLEAKIRAALAAYRESPVVA
jgi:hypothetical protein